MHWLVDPQIWASLLTLTALEIVLGIDNVLFLTILAERLPLRQQGTARRLGLALALITRLALLASIAWLARLTAPVVTLGDFAFSWRDLVLLGGGLFLVVKAWGEISDRIRGGAHAGLPRKPGGFAATVALIVLLDIVFSLDSVITAVGMANRLPVMMAAVVIAVGVMLVAAGPVARFIEQRPTVRMLALGFLLLVGATLVCDGVGLHVPKGYVYAAIGFASMIEGLNLLAARARRGAARADEAVICQPARSPRTVG